MCNPCYRRAYYAIHHEKENASTRAYYAMHSEETNVRSRAYYATHREEANALNRTYRAEHPEETKARGREQAHRRRILKRAGFVAPINIDDIYNRDRGICQICQKPVARKIVSLDHILPITYGGTHEPCNVRVTHRLCNIRRQHRGAAQLRLFG